MPKKIECREVTPAKLRELLSLRGAGTRGAWEVKASNLGGGMFHSLRITTWYRDRWDSKEGDIATVHVENTTYSESRGESAHHKHEIKTAEHDAKLIAEAVNWLEPMAQALLDGKSPDETGWLIEFPADRYGPIRYWSAGEPLPVISAGDATRFCRQRDAEAVIRSEKLPRASAVEHCWPTPLSEHHNEHS